MRLSHDVWNLSLRSSVANHDSPRIKRRGFTLIELLVVIAIIAVLVGLLMAGVQAVRKRAQEVKVRNDLTQLSTVIQEWKSKHGSMPSLIVLREDGMYGAHTNPVIRALELESITALKRIWPRLDTPQLAVARGNTPPFNGHDWNQDGTITVGDAGAFVLEGDQCLVFFLGGAQRNGSCIGFSTNKAYPMPPALNPTPVVDPPAFDFKTARLRQLAHAIDNRLIFLSYLDDFETQPYLYFSSRVGNDYRPLDCGTSGVSPYSEASVSKFYNRDGFQIICAGPDGVFGTGGVWDSASGAPYANSASNPGADDLTNFHPRRMGAGL